MADPLGLQVIHKVVAYVVRERGDRRELLVFDHPDFPEAGTQVPAGTVELGEAPDDALDREMREETGRDGFRRVRKLATYDHRAAPEQLHRRHVYLVRAPDDLPDRWAWGERVGTPSEIRFTFYWLPLTPRPDLSGGFGDYLGEISTERYED